MIFDSPVSALSSALSRSDYLTKLLLNLFILLVSIFGLVSGIFQLFFKLAHSLFILLSSALQHLPHTVTVISSCGGFVKLLSCNKKFVLELLKIILKSLHSPVQSINLQLSG